MAARREPPRHGQGGDRLVIGAEIDEIARQQMRPRADARIDAETQRRLEQRSLEGQMKSVEPRQQPQILRRRDRPRRERRQRRMMVKPQMRGAARAGEARSPSMLMSAPPFGAKRSGP